MYFLGECFLNETLVFFMANSSKVGGTNPSYDKKFITKIHYLLKHYRNHFAMFVISSIGILSYSYSDILGRPFFQIQTTYFGLF